MKYIYYPGCSLEGSAMEYDASTRSVLETLGAELVELEDWTCCGASASESQSLLLSLALPARNLALAERDGAGVDVLAPCSACYLNLKRVEENTRKDEGLLNRVNTVLSEDGLTYGRQTKTRHLLDVLANDFGAERIAEATTNRLSGFSVVPYYGCQCLRPFTVFDDPERPHTMEPLIEALGAEVFGWSMGGKCCGAGLMTTKKELGLELVGQLLLAAQGADCIATVCPMCQMNLEIHQRTASHMMGRDLRISVLYLPQLMGIAFGLPEDRIDLKRNFAAGPRFREKCAATAGR